MKKTIKRLIPLIIFIALPIFINAQENDVIVDSIAAQENDVIVDSIAKNFFRQAAMYPQEKLYAQIDKTYYITGEDIWFRAHLVDAFTHVPDTTSRYVYAELINPIDSVIRRVKIKPTDGVYQGHITLEEDLPEGEYQLRFYTRFMEGRGDDYFFKRTVRIGDPLTALYRTEPRFEYEGNKKVRVELKVIDIKTNTSVKPDKIQILDDNGNLKPVKAGNDNIIKATVKMPEKGGHRSFYFEYDYAGKFHKQFITIPIPSDYEISFLPEGGHNIAGSINKIAFKAINSDGLGEDFTGIIVNENGDTLRIFESQHLGMGSIILQSSVGEKFYAICENKTGVVKHYELPSATDSHVALQTIWQRDKLILSIRTPNDSPLDGAPLYLVMQCRGSILNVIKWEKEMPFISMMKEELPSGVIQFLLVDSNMNPMSERLVFNINDQDIANLSFATDKDNYGKREQVKVTVNLSDIVSDPQIANLSVSITDDNDVKPDTCVNILSTLLLTSELKGYIEDPAYYFKNKTSEAMVNLDLLMMTQGWSRYNVEKILKGEFDTPKSYLELGQEISGVVKGGLLMNKPAANYPVTLISMEGGVFDQTFTDDEGRFYFRGFESPDSTKFIIQGTSKKGSNRVELLLDGESFPSSSFTLPLIPFEDQNLFADYLEKADQNFILANGMRMIYLEDVEITAHIKNSKNKPGKAPFSSPFNPRFTTDEIEQMRVTSIFQILSRFAGVMVMGNKVSIRGATQPPLVLLDGLEYDVEFLENLIVDDVDEVEVIKDGGAAFFGGRANNGVIMITTKRGEVNVRKPQFNIKAYSPLGYQTTKEFYSPQYETKEQRDSPSPDMRTTIYWNPNVKTTEEGNADFNFYTSDASTSYSVIIEGVTSTGLLIYNREKISRKD